MPAFLGIAAGWPSVKPGAGTCCQSVTGVPIKVEISSFDLLISELSGVVFCPLEWPGYGHFWVSAITILEPHNCPCWHFQNWFFVVFSSLWLNLEISGKRCVLSLTFTLIVCFNSKHTALWLACFQNRTCASLKWLVFHEVCFLAGWMLLTFRKISGGEWLCICFCPVGKVAALGRSGWSITVWQAVWLPLALQAAVIYFDWDLLILQVPWDGMRAQPCLALTESRWHWAGWGGEGCRLGENGW